MIGITAGIVSSAAGSTYKTYSTSASNRNLYGSLNNVTASVTASSRAQVALGRYGRQIKIPQLLIHEIYLQCRQHRSNVIWLLACLLSHGQCCEQEFACSKNGSMCRYRVDSDNDAWGGAHSPEWHSLKLLGKPILLLHIKTAQQGPLSQLA